MFHNVQDFHFPRRLLHSARSLVSGGEIRLAGGGSLGCNTLCYPVFYSATRGRELQIPRHLESGIFNEVRLAFLVFRD